MTNGTTVAMLASFAESLVNFRGPLIELLRARSYRVIVSAPSASPALLAKLSVLGVTFHSVDIERNQVAPLQDLLYTWRIYLWLRRTRPNVLLAYTAKPVIYGLIAGRIARVANRSALITGLGYTLTGQSLERRILAWIVGRLYRLALRNCSCVMFQNRDDLVLFQTLRILSAQSRVVVVSGSGVDLQRFSPQRLPAEPIFLLIARLLRDKGIREYVDAARAVRSRHSSARFQLAGWTDRNPDAIEKEELDRWIAEGVIEYLGPLDDVRPALAAARIYVLPSHREGTPRTVLEAMATGRPVITTDAPGCRETVQHELNGLLVPVGDVPQLAAAMIRLIENPELAEAYAHNGLRIARERYDARVVSEAMVTAMGL